METKAELSLPLNEKQGVEETNGSSSTTSIPNMPRFFILEEALQEEEAESPSDHFPSSPSYQDACLHIFMEQQRAPNA